MMSKRVIFDNVLSEANSIMAGIRSYPKRRRAKRLYKQWAERTGLQPEVFASEGAKTKDAPLQLVTADRPGSKLSETREGRTQDKRFSDIPHEGPIPEDIRASANETIGAYPESNSGKKPRKVAMFVMAEIDKEQLKVAVLFVLLGASLVIFCLGFIMLIVYSLGL